MDLALVRLSLAGIALSASLFAFAMISKEFAAFRTNLGSARTQMQALQSQMNPATLPKSILGQVYLLDACLNTQGSSRLRLFPSDLRHSVYAHCQALSVEILMRSPSLALAHLVQAQSLARLGDSDGFSASLSRAQRQAPAEGWQASWRILLMLRHGLPHMALSEPGMMQDLKLMSQSSELAQSLASYYAAFPAWREVIARGVEQADPESQKRFFNAVRKEHLTLESKG